MLAPETHALIKPFWDIPVLPDTMTGDVVKDTVSANNPFELVSKINGVHNYTGRKYVLYVNAGEYRIPMVMNISRGAKNVVIRGITGNPGDVRIIGKGFNNRSADKEIISLNNCSYITLAHISFESAAFNGVKMEGGTGISNVRIYNCLFRNIGERCIKSTSGGKRDTSLNTDCEIVYCHFVCDSVHPSGYDDGFNGDYIGGVDGMGLNRFVFRNNVFENIRGANGNGRAAIFVWHSSRNVTSENNVFARCDNGVHYGNSKDASATGETFHMKDAMVRNNFFVRGTGTPVGLYDSENIKVYNNTIYSPDPATMTVSGEDSKNIQVRNNILTGRVGMRGTEYPDTSRNIRYSNPAWFKSVSAGDLHLTPGATIAMDAGQLLPDASHDIDGCAREGSPDIGADEFLRDNCTGPLILYDQNNISNNKLNLYVYPNPFNQEVCICVSMQNANIKMQNANLKILNMQGKILQSVICNLQSTITTPVRWDATVYPSGHYLVQASIGNKVLLKKITLLK
jgi:hypothetical protein